MAPPNTTSQDQNIATLAEAVAQEGYALSHTFFSPELSRALAQAAAAFFAQDALRPAQIGKGPTQKQREDIRGDRIAWLDGQRLSGPFLPYWQQLETLRAYFAEYFRLALPWFETHLAVYPPGSFYRRHLDQFRATTNRAFTFLLYLNEGWQPAHGGSLRLYLPAGPRDVVPRLGQFICFRSDLIEHEVLPTQQSRLSLSGWLRRDEVPLDLQTFTP
jgi:SM-20-related protein